MKKIVWNALLFRKKLSASPKNGNPSPLPDKKIMVHPLTLLGLRGGSDDQIHSCQSETSYPMIPKLCDF